MERRPQVNPHLAGLNAAGMFLVVVGCIVWATASSIDLDLRMVGLALCVTGMTAMIAAATVAAIGGELRQAVMVRDNIDRLDRQHQ